MIAAATLITLAEAILVYITAVAHTPPVLWAVLPAMRSIVVRHVVGGAVAAMAFTMAIVPVAIVVMMIHYHHVPAGPIERAEEE